MKQKYTLLVLILVIFYSCSCTGKAHSPEADVKTKTGFFFDTVITITIYDDVSDQLLDDCIDICKKYELLFSRTIPQSDISRINSGEQGFVADSETIQLINTGFYYSQISKGALDLTLAPVIQLWDFTSGNDEIPSDSDIKEALQKTGYEKLYNNEYTKGTQLTSDMLINSGLSLDVGAIAKGYIADKLKEYLTNNGVRSAFIDLGGNILCIGSKPDSSPFKVGIRKPFSESNELMKIVEVSGRSVVTSGVYERSFYKDGKLYHHIIDSSTGYPVDNNLLSVTIISDKSVDGDALSTACFVLGKDKGMELVNSLDNITAYFIDTDYRIYTNE